MANHFHENALTSCQIVRFKMHQIKFRLGARSSGPRPRWGTWRSMPLCPLVS